MRFSKTITAIKSMEAYDRKRFEKYLRSPYFEVPPAASALFDYLSDLRQNFSDKDLEVKAIAHQVPLLKTESIQAKAGTLLQTELKEYAALEFHRQQPHEWQRDLLRGLKQRHWFEWYEEELADALETMEAHRGDSLEYFAQQHYLTEIKNNGFDIKLNTYSYCSIAPVWQSLEVYYAIKKIRYYCEELNRLNIAEMKMFKAENEAFLLATLAPYCNLQHSYVWLFVTIYRMLSAGQVADALVHYRQVKALLEQHKTTSLSVAYTEAISYLRMFSIKYVNRGVEELYPEYLWCITFQIKHGLIKAKGDIAPTVFINLFNIAAKINHPPKNLLLFINELGPLLPATHRRNSLHFAQGIYLFVSGKYTEAGHHFAEVDFKNDEVMNAICRRWYFMSRFEQQPYGKGLDAVLSAFERYVMRHEDIPPFAKTHFKKFIVYAQKLLTKTLKKEKQELAKQLAAEEYFAGKVWLLKKLGHKARE